MFSKLPLENAEVWQLTKTETDVPALSARVKIGDQSLRVSGMHTMSPTSELRMRLRTEQLIEVAERLESVDEPSILMGDLNCTPWSPFLRDLIEACDFRDSRQGQGYLASWNVELPWMFWIPIDHAFVSDEICVHSRTLGNSAGSDHLPVIFEVSTAQ